MMTTNEEIETFRKLHLAANGETVTFTKEQGKHIDRLINLSKGYDAIQWLTQSGKVVFYWATSGFVIWWAVKGWVLGFLAKGMTP